MLDFEVFRFSIVIQTDTSNTSARFKLSDRHAGITLWRNNAQATTCGECEISKFAFIGIRFVVHPSAVLPYESTPKG